MLANTISWSRRERDKIIGMVIALLVSFNPSIGVKFIRLVVEWLIKVIHGGVTIQKITFLYSKILDFMILDCNARNHISGGWVDSQSFIDNKIKIFKLI